MLPQDRIKAKKILMKRVFAKYTSNKIPSELIDNILTETIIKEEERLNTNKTAINRSKDIKYWENIRKNFYNMTINDKKETIKNIIDKYYEEIAGRFDKGVYNFTYGIINKVLPFIFSTNSILGIFNPFGKKNKVEDNLKIIGEIESLKKLNKKGTIVLVPTHSSNIDSVIIGMSIARIGLPPFLYGAGINLFTNIILAYFMNRLGAYTVDREKTNSLYKNILKEFASISMEMDYNNIFFPGGGRNRSNIIENNLKLGLLGSTFNAYINNIKNEKKNPNIYVFPITISYHVCLEANTMIENHIRKSSTNIIIDDEFSKPEKITKLLFNSFEMELKVYFNVAPPLDVFGNKVDKNGNSLDLSGKIINPKSYLFDNDGNYVSFDEKNIIYVKRLGESIIKSYYKANVVLSNNILAFVMYYLVKQEIDEDEKNLYRFLRKMEKAKKGVPLLKVEKTMEKLLIEIKKLALNNEITISEEITEAKNTIEIINLALKIFSVYHKKSVIVKKNNLLFINDAKLTLYYKNRLEGYGLKICL